MVARLCPDLPGRLVLSWATVLRRSTHQWTRPSLRSANYAYRLLGAIIHSLVARCHRAADVYDASYFMAHFVAHMVIMGGDAGPHAIVTDWSRHCLHLADPQAVGMGLVKPKAKLQGGKGRRLQKALVPMASAAFLLYLDLTTTGGMGIFSQGRHQTAGLQ